MTTLKLDVIKSNGDVTSTHTFDFDETKGCGMLLTIGSEVFAMNTNGKIIDLRNHKL